MLALLARDWWTLAVRGLIALLLGLAAFICRGTTLRLVILLLGDYLLADGIFLAMAAVRGPREHKRWWVLLPEG